MNSPCLGALGPLPNEPDEGHLTRTLEDILAEEAAQWCGCDWSSKVCPLVSGDQGEGSKEIREWA